MVNFVLCTTGKIVACGGMTYFDMWLEDDCHVYEPLTNTWDKVGDLPGGGRYTLASITTFVVDFQIFFVGLIQ